MATRSSSNDEGGGIAASSSSSSRRRTRRRGGNALCRRRLSICVMCLATSSTATATIAASSAVASSALRGTPGASGGSGAPPSPSSPHRRRDRRAWSSSSSTTGAVGELRGGGGQYDGGDDDDDRASSPPRSGTKRKMQKKKKKKKKTLDDPKEEGGGGVVVGGKRKSVKEGTSGGGGGGGGRRTTTTEEARDEAKDAIDGAMRGKDAASALGDAIRDRADVLRRDPLLARPPRIPRRGGPGRDLDDALVSVGLSLGTAGTDDAPPPAEEDGDDEDGGEGEGEEAAGGGGRVDAALAYYRFGHRGEDDRRRGTSSAPDLLADYFLKTHGGTHAAQTLLSLAASALGVACLFLPPFPSPSSSLLRYRASGGGGTTTAAATTTTADASLLSRRILLSALKCRLMQQALLVATARHASGMMGAVNVGARLIPLKGVRDARTRLESIASDPVGQYLFYCSLLAVWMGWFGGGGGGGGGGGMGGYLAGLRGTVFSVMNADAAAGASADAAGATATAQLLDALSRQPPPWYMCQSPYGAGSVVPILVLAPVLLREVTSVMWVCSDVLALLSSSSSSPGGGGVASAVLSKALSSSRAGIDAFMSLIVTPERWRDADSFRRQRTLSSLVSRTSLLAELAVGGVLIADAAQSFWTFAFVGQTATGGGVGGGRSHFGRVVGKMTCAHLYLNFLLSRRKKISQMRSVPSEEVHS